MPSSGNTAGEVLVGGRAESANKKVHRLQLASFATACMLSSAPALALDVVSVPGTMRCTAVIGCLSSAQVADRMPVLTWAQSYLSGMAAAAVTTAMALDGMSDVDVPAYDALQPRILKVARQTPRRIWFTSHGGCPPSEPATFECDFRDALLTPRSVYPSAT